MEIIQSFDIKKFIDETILLINNNIEPVDRGAVIREIHLGVLQKLQSDKEYHEKALQSMPKLS